MFKLSMASEVPPGAVMGYASAVVAAAAILYLLTGWMVRRTDR